MKSSAIPAQITTVEDRIAGNLNLTQLLLLVLPIFLTAVIFFLLPPVGKYVLYKLVISIICIGCSSILAIRINDKLVLDLIRLRLNFELRPRIYVYRKQRPLEVDIKNKEVKPKPTFSKVASLNSTNLSLNARAKSERLLRSHKYSVAFKSKDGGLSVKVSAP